MTIPSPMGDRVIVIPYYEAETVYSLYIPDSAKNPMAQQGLVVAVGSNQKSIQVDDYILFHPYVAEVLPYRAPTGEELFSLEMHQIAGWLTSDGEIFPVPGHVLIKPIFAAPAAEKKGLIWTAGQTFHVDPPMRGTVVRIGAGVTTPLILGDEVIFPWQGEEGRQTVIGHEIGLETPWSRQVWYVIHEDHLLATVEHE